MDVDALVMMYIRFELVVSMISFVTDVKFNSNSEKHAWVFVHKPEQSLRELNSVCDGMKAFCHMGMSR